MSTPAAFVAPRTRSAFDPRSLVFWVGVGLLIYGIVQAGSHVAISLLSAPVPGAFALLLWSGYAAAVLALIQRFAAFERRPALSIAMAFVWGGFIATGIGTVAAPAAHSIAADLVGADNGWATAIGAGAVEEPLKMLGLVALALIPGARIRSAADGLFYGAIIGLGFEVVESFLYSTQWEVSGTSFSTIVLYLFLRGFVGGLASHPTYSAIAGAGVGYFFGSTASAIKRWAVMLGTLLLAIVLHIFFDSPLLEFDNPLPSTAIKSIPVIILALIIVRIVRGKQRKALEAGARDVVPDELVSPADFESLRTRKARKQAVKAMKKEHGRKAARALTGVQRAQLDLLVSALDDGMESVEARAAWQRLYDAQQGLREHMPTAATG
ncbi:PrsW family intramembrane metalloprotease [Demequina zhanjiangensis]|uniref:PrsW family glutamic-type intramembrane protease n=1 Tax=Demequina zhanjiangensis TaxID=3051659 RepID=A0ABT8FZN0_9MICO|nr:PrsW family glutamic-type intramembrane protease [Demequina sp. SYSU T00b26]MDN4472222.1 PrsW family glutamic-type intramembrane protease [Demequina sp. SYSU T00b26]